LPPHHSSDDRHDHHFHGDPQRRDIEPRLHTKEGEDGSNSSGDEAREHDLAGIGESSEGIKPAYRSTLFLTQLKNTADSENP